MNNESFGRDTALAIVDGAGGHRRLYGERQVGARHHDEWVAAAQLHDRRLDGRARRARHAAPSTLGAGQRDGLHALIVQDRFDALAADEQRLEHVHRESGLGYHALDGERTPRHVAGVLEQAHIARHEGWPDKPERLPVRKIPWHHRQNNAQRLIGHVRLLSLGHHLFVGQKLLGVLGVVAATHSALLHLGHGGAQGLAHLAGRQSSQLLLAGLQDVGGAVHPGGPLSEGAQAVTVKGYLGACQTFLDLLRGQGVVTGKGLARHRVDAFYLGGHAAGLILYRVVLCRLVLGCGHAVQCYPQDACLTGRAAQSKGAQALACSWTFRVAVYVFAIRLKIFPRSTRFFCSEDSLISFYAIFSI